MNEVICFLKTHPTIKRVLLAASASVNVRKPFADYSPTTTTTATTTQRDRKLADNSHKYTHSSISRRVYLCRPDPPDSLSMYTPCETNDVRIALVESSARPSFHCAALTERMAQKESCQPANRNQPASQQASRSLSKVWPEILMGARKRSNHWARLLALKSDWLLIRAGCRTTKGNTSTNQTNC